MDWELDRQELSTEIIYSQAEPPSPAEFKPLGKEGHTQPHNKGSPVREVHRPKFRPT